MRLLTAPEYQHVVKLQDTQLLWNNGPIIQNLKNYSRNFWMAQCRLYAKLVFGKKIPKAAVYVLTAVKITTTKYFATQR
jgi:hypothetical protein